MAGLMLNDTDVIRLADAVNRQQAAGYAPVGGLVIGNGVFYQYMVTGGNGGVAYSIVLTQSDVAFQEEASAHAGSGLGTCQFLNGWFVQAFGAEASGGAASVAWGDITGKPATFAPIVGTGATQAMPGNTALTAISGTLTVAKGGTGATTAAAAWTALGGGAVGKLASLPTASTTVAGIIQIGTGATQAMAGNKTLANIGGVVPAAGLPKAAATPDLATDADLPTTVAKVNALLAALRTAGYVTP